MIFHPTCGAFQRFEDAKHNTFKKNINASSSSSSLSNCFQCGQLGHWARTCLWKETKCPNDYPNLRNLWTSKKDASYIWEKIFEMYDIRWIPVVG